MFLNLLLLFTLVPILELYLLFEVSDEIGGLNTIAIIFITGILGAALARSQGRSVYANIQGELAQGQIPADGLLSGLLVFGGGLLLLTPGFFTDFLGFTMVFPLTRMFLVRYLKNRFTESIKSGRTHVHFGFGGFNGAGGFERKPQQQQNQHRFEKEERIFRSENEDDVIDVDTKDSDR